MTSFEKPYQISVPDSALSDLQKRLSLIRFPDELEDANWDYGVPLRDVQRLITRWKDGYDWRQYERELNETLPMFTMDVAVEGHDVINVHYVHQRSKVVNAVPLLFVHGCEYFLTSHLRFRVTLLNENTKGLEASSRSRRFFLC